MRMETQAFLPLIEERLEYMVSKRYFSEKPVLASGDSDMLEYTNFHYLLGYCRNYHKLKKKGAIPGNPALSEVLDIVRMDTQVSSLIYNYLRQAEQALRTAWVHVFCDERSPFEYLNPDAYYSTNQNKTGGNTHRGYDAAYPAIP